MMNRPEPPMTQSRLSSLQLSLTACVFLYSSTLLSSVAYRSQGSPWLTALIGCLLGTVWICFISRCDALWSRAHKWGQLPILPGLLILLLTNLSDFGLFWRGSFKPALPPALIAMMLYTLALLAVYHGTTCIGRFAQMASLSLLPLALLLILGLKDADFTRLIPPAPSLLPLPLRAAKGGLGILVSHFGDGVALGILAGDLASGREQTVYASKRLCAASPLPPLLFGALGASGLFLLTTLTLQARLPASLLATLPYPVPHASAILHKQVLDPLFLLCLTLLYTVKLQVLLLACCRILGRFLPPPPSSSKLPAVAPALIPLTASVFAFLPVLALVPNLPLAARSSPILYLLLVLSEFFTPFCLQIISFFKKRFDKSPLL